MANLINSSRYDEIRAALDLSLDKNNLPDTLIEKDLFLGQADRWVKARVVNPTTNPAAHNAEIYYCAYLLFDSLPQIVSEKAGTGEGYTRKATQLTKADLLARAEEQIQLAQPNVDETDESSDMPTMFTLACGRRGR